MPPMRQQYVSIYMTIAILVTLIKIQPFAVPLSQPAAVAQAAQRPLCRPGAVRCTEACV